MWIPDDVLDHVRGAAEEPDLTGTRYRLLRVAGRGGMSVVYAAHDRELDREVAIKVSNEPAPDAVDRAKQEARVIARLEHPGIVPVHDAGVLPDGRVYYVMKLVRGERLDAWAAAEGRGVRDALRLLQRVCEAVAFAHAHGVVHRDLKPENVMVGPFGEALVMDWGIARDLAAESQEVAGAVVGTRAYMAPEQADGDRDAVGARTDVYALGATLRALLGAHARVPPPLASICRKATATAPSDRYESASALAEDIGRWLDAEPVRAHREGAGERVARIVSRHRVVLSLLAAYLVLRLVLIAVAR
jgi:serine/threonine-protein kinase